MIAAWGVQTSWNRLPQGPVATQQGAWHQRIDDNPLTAQIPGFSHRKIRLGPTFHTVWLVLETPVLIGYARISKADGSQSLDPQRDALREAGVSDDAIYQDQAFGQRQDRPGLAAFLKAARQGDVIVVWRLDRLGRNLRHLVNLVQDLNDRDIEIRVLAGQGASIDTTTASGKLVFAIFAALAEFERELIRERTLAGLASARARGRKGGRPHALSKAPVRLAQAAMAQRDTKVSELCLELGVTKATIYRYVAPDGSLRNRGRQALAR